MSYEVRLFGSISVRTPDRVLGPKDFTGRKPKQLLEVLLVQEGRPVAKDQLAESLWGKSLPVNFPASLEHYVSLLRKRLDPDRRLHTSLVRTVHGGYRCDMSAVDLDTRSFDQVYDRHVSGQASRTDLDLALALARGDLLEDEPYADWVIGPRAHYAQRHLELLVAAARLALADGDTPRGAELATVAVARDSYSEAAHRILMLAHYAMGRQSAALVAFDRCREHLNKEVGVDPLPETSRLQAAILGQEPVGDLLTEYAGAPRAKPIVAAESPLVPVPRRSPDHPLPFVGRERELEALVAACSPGAEAGSAPVVVLDGPPGSGKTRTVREVAARMGDRPVILLTATSAEESFAGSTAAHFLTHLLPGDPRLVGLLDALPTIASGSSGLRGTIALQVLAMVADHGPFVAVIDDAEHIDEVSAQVLACLAMRLPPGSAAFLLAVRCGQLTGAHPLANTLNVTRITLPPLTPASLEGFGVTELHERSGGLPLLVAFELALRDPGVDPVAGDPVDHYRRLGDRLFQVCVVAAVAEWISPEAIARLTRRDVACVVDDLELLCTRQVMRLDGETGGFVFQNEAVRILLATVPSPARRHLIRGRSRAKDDSASRRRTARPVNTPLDRRAGPGDRRADRPIDPVAGLRSVSAG